MIGCDIVDISRVKKDASLLAERILSLREQKEYQKRKGQAQYDYLAGRFAAKEAYVKASGNRDVTYKEIEILDDEKGKPHLFYKKEEKGEVTLAHDGFAIAFVVL